MATPYGLGPGFSRDPIPHWGTPTNYGALQRENISQRFPSTCEWVLASKEYRDWLHGQDHTLFCPGEPGVGKTILAAAVIQDLQGLDGPMIGVAYIYFSTLQAGEQDLQNLVFNLLKQLVPGLRVIPFYLEKMIDGKHEIPSVRQILEALHATVKLYSQVFVVLDALDECQAGSRTALLREILVLQSMFQTKIFLTSRFDPDIITFDALILQIRAHEADLRRFAAGKLFLLLSLIEGVTNVHEEILSKVVESANGNFLLGKLHLDSLLSQRSSQGLQSAFAKLSSGPEAHKRAYDNAMERITSQSRERVDLARRVLAWLSRTRCQLTIIEVQDALATELGSSNVYQDNLPQAVDIVLACCGLVTLGSESGIVQLLHHTTREYLYQTEDLWLRAAQQDVGTTCVTYLLRNEFAGGICMTDTEIERRAESNPLYVHAARNWGYYNGKTGPPSQQLLTFLSSRAKVEAACQVAMAACQFLGHSYDGRSFPKNMSSMHVAAYAGAENIIYYLLKSKADINMRDNYGQTPLSLASQRGHDTIVDILLADPCVVMNVRNVGGRTPLSLAAEAGHARIVKELLNHDADPNLRDLRGASPLWYAAEAGHTSVVKLLLARPADLNMKIRGLDNFEYTPLATAVWNGHMDVATLLSHQEGIDFYARFPDEWATFGPTLLEFSVKSGYQAFAECLIGRVDSLGWPSSLGSKEKLIHIAARTGSGDIVTLLLSKYGVNPNGIVPHSDTPLMTACEDRHCEAIVRVLLGTSGIQPSLRGRKGKTALSIAAKYGNTSAVQLLLARVDVDPNCKDDEGLTPLALAVENLHEPVVELLLQVEGIILDSRDASGNTLLWYAISKHKESQAMVRRLLATGRVCPNMRNADGKTPLHRVVGRFVGDSLLIKTFLSYPGTDPDAVDNDGSTPMLDAAAVGNWAAVKLLIETSRVDLNRRRPDKLVGTGWTVLGCAAGEGQEAIVRSLLGKSGIDMNKPDSYGRTPLARAAGSGDRGIVEQLLAVPCTSRNPRDLEGRTPLSEAARWGSEAILEILLGLRDVDPNSRDIYGRTPLSLAAEAGQVGTVTRLLAADGIDPDSRDNRERTPLSWAIAPEKNPRSYEDRHLRVESLKEVIRLLIQIDVVDPNAEDDDGWTPLARAIHAYRGDEIIDLLLSRSDVNVRYIDKNSRSAFSIAIDKGNEVIALMLGVHLARTSGKEENINPNTAENLTLIPGVPSVDVYKSSLKHYSPLDLAWLTKELQLDVRISLGRQETTEDLPGNSSLCERCKMIDLTDAFTCRPTRCSGRIIADLGCIDQQMAMNTCGLCRLMFTVRPQVNPQICTDTASYQLRAFSSTNIWLCENSGSCHKRFTTEWIDTVFLAVVRTDSTEIGDYPEEPMISRPGPCNNVLHSGFIGRVGSNCPYQARAISVRRPNNKIDFELVRSWIARCIGSHSGECQSATQGEIPYLRLINCVSRKIVSPSSEVSFVALSYVWGVISAFQVPEDGDNLIILERVVEDAIQVTISLGYTYLWVDRHCILQHDEHVKEVQLQNMNAVYANADITIVAVAGEDSSFGLPGAGKRTRISLPYMLAQGHLLSVIPPDPSREIRSSKWSTRGWTYQEGLLSRRRLFLTEYEVSYDCSKSLCRETIALPAHIEQRPHGVEQQLHESSWMFPNAHITLAPDSIIRLFDRLSEYTARQLSRESDVLNAMLGIFQVYGNLKYPIHHLCGVPIMPFFGFNWWNIEAGISYECFIDGLRWLLLKPASRRSGFPSWSWTGWRGVVASHWSCYEYLICKWDPTDELPLSLDEDEDEVFEEEVPWMELSIMEAGGPLRWEDYSRLSSTETLTRFHQCHTLEITAFTIEVSLRKGSACEWAAIICFGDEVMEGTFYQTKDASEDMQFDRNLQEERWLGIVLGNRLEHDKSMMTCVLVLQEYRQRRCWERIGLAKIRNSTLREEMCKRQTITLQ